MSNTDVPVKVNTFVDGATIFAAPINQNFDDLFTALANIGTANMLADAVTEAKILNGAVSLAKLAAAVQAALAPTGTMMDYIGTTAPTGWVLADGNTIGDASSGATRANADTETLFLLLWNSFANTEAAVSTGRGASAAADFAAHKRIAVPDLRGRVRLGKDNMGGVTAGNVTSAGGNFDATVNGKTGGVQNHAITTAQMPVHTHSVTDPAHTHTDAGHAHNVPAGGPGTGASIGAVSGVAITTSVATQSGAANLQTNTTGISIQNAGSGNAHPNVQPAIAISVIIKL